VPVVINEFEVVPSEAPQKRETSSSPGQGESEPRVEPQQIEQMLERERERCERILAH
jgi:hypothetical protein